MAPRPACECGTCARCRDRLAARARRLDPGFRAGEAERARHYRAAKRRDRLWQEEQRRRRRELYESNAADPEWRLRRNRRERRRRARQREHEALPGLPLDELARRIAMPLALVNLVIGEEVRRGRVVQRRDGTVALLADGFEPGVLDAMEALLDFAID